MATTGSIFFDGGSYLTFPSSSDWAPSTSDFTIEWFQKLGDFTLAASKYPRVFSVGAYNDTTISIAATIEGGEGSQLLYLWNNMTASGFEMSGLIDEWSHIAICYVGGSDMHLYVNGVEAAGSPIVGGYNIADASTILTIGQEFPTDTNNSFFTGSLTSFRWTNGVALYTASFYPPLGPLETTMGCVLLLNSADSGSLLVDDSGTGKTATNYGVTWTADSPFPFAPLVTPTPTPVPTDTPTPTPSPTPLPPTLILAIDPLLYVSSTFPLGPEFIAPYSASFQVGDNVQLSASQQFYSFDYYEIWSPNTVACSSYSYISMFGFTASFDPRTVVTLNNTSSIVGTNYRTRYGIVAHYR